MVPLRGRFPLRAVRHSRDVHRPPRRDRTSEGRADRRLPPRIPLPAARPRRRERRQVVPRERRPELERILGRQDRVRRTGVRPPLAASGRRESLAPPGPGRGVRRKAGGPASREPPRPLPRSEDAASRRGRRPLSPRRAPGRRPVRHGNRRDAALRGCLPPRPEGRGREEARGCERVASGRRPNGTDERAEPWPGAEDARALGHPPVRRRRRSRHPVTRAAGPAIPGRVSCR